MKRNLIAVFILIFTIPVNAELKLDPLHPDEPVKITFNTRYSIESSLQSLNGIRSALDRFIKLTEASKQKINLKSFRKLETPSGKFKI